MGRFGQACFDPNLCSIVVVVQPHPRAVESPASNCRQSYRLFSLCEQRALPLNDTQLHSSFTFRLQ